MNNNNNNKTQHESPEKKLSKEIKGQLEIKIVPRPCNIAILAKSRLSDYNSTQRVPLKRGIPIGGYVYDSMAESYAMRGIEVLILGPIPISVSLSMREMTNWMVEVPMPPSVIKKYLSLSQKNELKRFQTKFPEQEYILEFIQFLSSV